MKKFLLCLIAVLINFITVSFAYAENFYIKNYDVNIKVKENNDIQVLEDIDVYFTAPSHGIYRTISLKPGDKIAGIYTNDKINSYASKSGVNYSVKIGDANNLITGDHHYSIGYTYKTNLDNSNEFYFNIIGTDWPVPIEKAKFYITMPKKFDKNKVGLSIGRYGTKGFDGGAVYRVNGLNISGDIQRILHPSEGVTIRIELPNDYFSKSKPTDLSKNEIYTIIGIIILTFIAFIVWFIYGKDEPVTPVVNFYPPKNKNSAEAGVEYKGQATNKELTSLVFYLASKGYLKIEDDGISFILTKLKEYDGKNSIEKRFLRALFKQGDTVTKEELELSREFYKECEVIISSLNKIKGFIFDKNACSIEKIAIMILSIAGIIIGAFYSFLDYSFESFITTISSAGFILIFPIVAIIALLSVLLSNKSTKSSKFFICIWAAGFGGIPAVMLSNIISFPNFNYIVLLTAIIGLVISIICFINLPKRNRTGRIALGHLLGFKQFLEVAEKRRIQQLVDENPEYCFDILPYAYVLDVSDAWIKNFEGISQTQPSWYCGPCNAHSFRHLSNAIESSSKPSVANGGISKSRSSGGGGFSGGGHGGGGGGSW